ncbi:MAG: energy transducer TonB [Bacteroidales bacterium]|nr:energy transducer TonB [Bacteroidales bacterium]
MKVKKEKRANLERNKSTFFLLGMVVTLGLVLISFEWGTEKVRVNPFTTDGIPIDQTMVPITHPDQPEPPKPPQVVIPEILEIIDNGIPLPDPGIIFGGDPIPGDIPLTRFTDLAGKENKDDDIFVSVQEMPKFRGGDENKFSQWVHERIRYPQISQEIGIQGKVFISFIVEPDGTLSNVTIQRGVDQLLDEESLRVVSSSPRWTPGKQQGVPVRVRHTITINFKLL